MNLKDHIRAIPDFPEPGILFYDISTLLQHPGAFAFAIERLADLAVPHRPARLMAIESRGFIFGAPLARQLGIGLGLIRKKGKLPGSVMEHAYDLEYGSDTIEVSSDLLEPGTPVVVIDDLIATGGTAAASVELLRKVGADVRGAIFLIELRGLDGRERLPVRVEAVLSYDL